MQYRKLRVRIRDCGWGYGLRLKFVVRRVGLLLKTELTLGLELLWLDDDY